MDAVVAAQGYATLADAGDIGGERESSFGVDEPSAVRYLLRWLDGLPRGQRFLATYLPIAGHHPYDAPPGGPFPENEEVGRYRNALRYADTALAQLIEGLRTRGLLDDTLLVVCGDHGEAFGEHRGNFGHTFFLYEENVRVPLVLWAPRALAPERVERVASLADLAPTVLDLLGMSAPSAWEGRSLLSGPRGMALFCTDYGLGLLGLRDGRWKFIHELDSERDQLFDLEDDPQEREDVAGEYPERAAAYREHLRRWAAAQKYRLTRGGE
jgi:arylsulfatase A-like enzyme